MSEKEKLKKGHPNRNKFAFIIMWLMGHMLAFGAFIPIVAWANAIFDDTGFVTILALVVGGITSLTQYLLIRWQFGRNIKWWIPLSIIAWLISAFTIFQVVENLSSSQFDITLQALALFTPPALVQTFLLRKQVQQAWLWLLASVAGTTTFALPIAFAYGEDWTILVGYGLYASATALTLLWLFGMSGIPIKQEAKDKTHNQLTDSDTSVADTLDYLKQAGKQYKKR